MRQTKKQKTIQYKQEEDKQKTQSGKKLSQKNKTEFSVLFIRKIKEKNTNSATAKHDKHIKHMHT